MTRQSVPRDTATDAESILWAKTAPAAPARKPLTDNEEADVAIVGGGYTGLSAALHLALESKVVRLLEAAEIGLGCSGRNGGQVNPGGTRLFPNDVIARLGPQNGRKFIKIGHESCDLVFELIKAHHIACDAVRPGYVQGGWGRTGANYVENWVRQWAEYGVEVQALNRAKLADLIGTDVYDNGFSDPRGGNIHPVGLSLGMAAAAERAGAKLHGNSRVTSIGRDGVGWRVSCSTGSVRAKHVLICTNGYTDGLWPGLSRSIVTPTTFTIASEPLGAERLKSVLPGKHAVAESSRLLYHYRLDHDGRFVIGGRGNVFDVSGEGSVEHIKRTAIRYFPNLAGIKWIFRWAGWPAMTLNRLPMLLKLDHNVLSGLGYNGRGVAMATMMGKQLSLAVLGTETEMEIRPLAPIMFHTFRQVGISYHILKGLILDTVDRRRRA